MLPEPPPLQVSGMGSNSLPQHDIRPINQDYARIEFTALKITAVTAAGKYHFCPGLLEGDTILLMNGVNVHDDAALKRGFRNLGKGVTHSQMTLTVGRAGSQDKTHVTVHCSKFWWYVT
jgi:hypothetical protein